MPPRHQRHTDRQPRISGSTSWAVWRRGRGEQGVEQLCAVPTLRVIRLSDKRVIYPFRGCADMPLCEDPQSAKNFAEAYGWQLVNGDIAVPE